MFSLADEDMKELPPWTTTTFDHRGAYDALLVETGAIDETPGWRRATNGHVNGWWNNARTYAICRDNGADAVWRIWSEQRGWLHGTYRAAVLAMDAADEMARAEIDPVVTLSPGGAR